MKTKEKGYSLGVLVITVAVMIILITTAITTMRNLTGDRKITYFMSDMQEVEDYVKDYYSRKNALPISYQNDGKPREVTMQAGGSITMSGEMKNQLRENDVGAYYVIDLNKLGKIKLKDATRGYVVNEGSLNIYVTSPIEYQGVEYYTLTDEILGKDTTEKPGDFEVIITGNPVTWATSAKLLLSLPAYELEQVKNWEYKYAEGGPISIGDFRTINKTFEYGEPVEIKKNGICSFYVKDDAGNEKVINVIITKIDDINPYIYVTNEDKIVAGDDETGIRRIMYKIRDYHISENDRAEMVDTYYQGIRSYLPDASNSGKWTYVVGYTGEGVNDIVPSIGRDISSYKKDYEKYLDEYNDILADPSGDTRTLDNKYPQFQHNGEPYGDEEVNIVLYVEDYAGNRSVTDKSERILCEVSRKMLLDSSFIETIIKPLKGGKVVINNGDKYTNDPNNKVDLAIRVQGAEKMFITTDESATPPSNLNNWLDYQTSYPDYELPGNEGKITVYVWVTAGQTDDSGNLIYERIESSIIVDKTPPSTNKPDGSISNDLKLSITCNQKDSGSGIAKVEYAYRAEGASIFTWLTSLNDAVLEEGKVYEIKTRATDYAGNTSESAIAKVQAPIQIAVSVPNEPALATGMTAIMWDGSLTRPEAEMRVNPDSYENASGEKTVWYSYHVGNNMTDTRENMWANAKTADGSYWVWIPRYAYRIIYYTDESKSTIKGYFQNSSTSGQGYFSSDGVTRATDAATVKSKYLSIDIIFLNGSSNTQYREENVKTKVVTVKNLPAEYIVHPAFQAYDTSTLNNPFGKWSANVSGIWVAKFEASRSDATYDNAGVSTTMKSVPSVKAWTNISIEDAYNNAKNMNTALSSHLMKNSEWGAVAYLAYSGIGRNGVEVSSNRDSDHITGAGGRTSAYSGIANNVFLNTYAFNSRDTGTTNAGMYASTTGNIYGVYDMAGGVAEYVSAYLNNGNGAQTSYSTTLRQTTNPELRELYTAASSDAEINNYKQYGVDDGIYGGALFESSTQGSGTTSVGSASSAFPATNNPFVTRGGEATSSSSGIFGFEHTNGNGTANIGFRPVLAFR